MKINLKPLLIWIFPVFISFFFELFFTDFKWYNLKNLIENLLVLGFILIVVSLFSNRFKYKIDKLAYIIFSIIIITESAYYYIFNSFFTSSVIYIVLETNYMEVTEFIGNYMSIELLIYLLITSSFALFFSLKSYESVFIFSSLSKPFLKIILLASIFLVLFTSKLYYFNFPFQVVKGTIEYVQEIKKYESFDIQNSYGNFKNVEFEGSTEDHTFVLIIGESTTRHQLGIYDFYRPTTPYLSEDKEELLIYKDVISSESHTIESLQSALSLNNFTKSIESTIIQLMNQAGFKTFWLSNQPPIGIYDTLLTKVAKASDTEVFTNWSHYGIETPYDEVLLPHLDSALMDTANRKFIVIHLLATHGIYKLRHPKEFEVFTDIPDTNFKSESNFEKINS